MALVGTLTRCLYSRDDPVVGSINTLDWCCPWIFVASTAMCCVVVSTIIPCSPCALVLYWWVTCSRSYLFPMWCPLQSSCASSLNILIYFYLFAADGVVSCMRVYNGCYISLGSTYVSTLGGGAVWSLTMGFFSSVFVSYWGGLVVHSCFRG